MITGFFAAVGAWFAARKIALILYGIVAALIVAGAFGLIEHGKSIAEAKCDSAAKQAQIEALQRDLKIISDRAARDAEVIDRLREQSTDDAARIDELAAELAKSKQQSTAPGAKIDENALLDDRCNYTARGARRVRE